MGEKYELEGVSPPSKETMDKIKGIIAQYHDNVYY